jgi:fatty acid kinase
MPETGLDVADLKAGLLRAGEYLQKNYQILDNLNVFPVPDGDTGTNMLATYQAGIQNLPETETISDVAISMNESLTRQSRGNSGFILARFFHGFFEVTGQATSISHQHLTDGFANGSYHVNTSLFSPVEGTMITIIAAMTEALRLAEDVDVRTGLRVGLDAARNSLFETPRLLKILAKAGVVDSGALGFVFLMEGFHRGLMNQDVESEDESLYRFQPDPSVIADMQESEQMHRYCTEVLLRPSGGETPGLSEFLKANGSSIALVQEEALLKVHIHTDDPDHVVVYLATLGTVENTKIEDMQEQMGLFAKEEDPESVNMVLACVPGTGFRDILVSLGIENCLVYSTELPATATILDAIETSQSRNITILPNNKNILPSAMLARDRSDKNVSILPTENVIHGLAALYGYSENATMQDNMTNMADCMNMVDSIFLYRSVADMVFDRTQIQKGDYFCVRDGHTLVVGPDPQLAAMEAMRGLHLEDKTNVCLYYSSPEAQDTAKRILAQLTSDHPDIEVECLFGGQPREYLIISME